MAGIHYSESFRTATAMAGGGYFPRYRYLIGEAAVALFDQNAAEMFARTARLPSIPETADTAAGADVVLVLRFETLSSLVFFEVGAPTPIESAFRLQAVVSAPDGPGIASTEAVIPMPTPPDSGTSSTGPAAQAVARKTLVEAINELSISLVQSPELARWAESRGLAWQWTQGPSVVAGISPPAGVAIVFCHGLYDCSATEGTVAVGEELHKLEPSLPIVAAEDLQRVLHPWLSRTAPAETQEFELLSHPAFAARAGALGVRYLVIAESLEMWSGHHGGGIVGIPAPWVGLYWSTVHESARMRVFDFATATVIGEIGHQRHGDLGWVMPVYILPLPIPVSKPGDGMFAAIAKQLLQLLQPAR